LQTTVLPHVCTKQDDVMVMF